MNCISVMDRVKKKRVVKDVYGALRVTPSRVSAGVTEMVRKISKGRFPSTHCFCELLL